MAKDSLSRLTFAVFGLGDSSYPIYNAVARRLFQRLLNLGASPLVERGLGDDQHPLGYDGDLGPWSEKLYSVLTDKFNVEYDSAMASSLPDPCFSIKKSLSTAHATPAMTFGRGVNQYTSVTSTVLSNSRVTPENHFQDARLLRLENPEHVLQYAPGDVLLIHPKNPPSVVDQFMKEQLPEWDPNDMVDVDLVDPSAPVSATYPSTLSIKTLCSAYLDLCGIPTRYFFQVLSSFATAEHEMERLAELAEASMEGQYDYLNYCYREKRSYVDVLHDFVSVRLPFERILEFIPRLQPRQYSIASSPAAHAGEIHVLAALVKFTTPRKREVKGVCSQWFKTLQEQSKVQIWIKQSTFSLPKDPTRPLVMVGPGTGIAPFRSMCWERYALDENTARLDVFFGNRNRDMDFFFAEEWMQLEQRGVVTQFHTAFSRDQESKIYVQHRLLDQAAVIWSSLVLQGGFFYLAGAAGQMPKDVREALVTILEQQGRVSRQDAEALLRKMEKSGRCLVECW